MASQGSSIRLFVYKSLSYYDEQIASYKLENEKAINIKAG